MYFDSLAQSVATLTLCLLRPVSLLVRIVVCVFLLCESASVGMRKLRTLECIFTDQQHFVRRLTEQSVLHGLLVMLFILLGSMTATRRNGEPMAPDSELCPHGFAVLSCCSLCRFENLDMSKIQNKS